MLTLCRAAFHAYIPEDERSDISAAYLRRFQSADSAVAYAALKAWCLYEQQWTSDAPLTDEEIAVAGTTPEAL